MGAVRRARGSKSRTPRSDILHYYLPPLSRYKGGDYHTRNSTLQRGSSWSAEESAGNQRRDDVRGNGFTPANRIHAFIGLRLQVNLL